VSSRSFAKTLDARLRGHDDRWILLLQQSC
jgi:hypothetical protein